MITHYITNVCTYVYWFQVIAYHEAVANTQQTAVQTQYIGQYALLNETANISKDHEVHTYYFYIRT